MRPRAVAMCALIGMADRFSNTAEPWARRRISVWPLYEKIDGRAMGARAG